MSAPPPTTAVGVGWGGTGRVAVAALALLQLGATSACGEAPLTQLVVVVDSDIRADAFDALRVEVVSPAGSHQSADLPLARARPLPATLSLVHSGGALGPVTITASARRAGVEVVARTVRTAFVSAQTRRVTIHLLGVCAGLTCEPGQTCGERGCAPPDVAAETLPRWTGEVPPGLPIDPGADAAPPPMDAEPPIDGSHDAGPSDAATPGDGGGDDAGRDADPGCVGRHPPPRPSVGPDPAGFQRFFAIQRVDIGIGAPGAWRDIGLDLDDQCTTTETLPETLECATGIGVGQADGDEGIDNQFGAVITGAIAAIDPDLLADFNTSFARGTYGVVLSVSGWNLAADDDAVAVALVEASSGRGPLGTAPEHIGEDVWTVSTDSLIGGDLERPLCVGTGYVSGGVVVAQLPTRCGFRLVSAELNVVDVRLSRATVTLSIMPSSPSFGSGQLVGRWRVDDLIGTLDQLSESLCPATARMALTRAADTAADLLAEDPANASIPCDAISFGARFRANGASVAREVGPSFPLIDYCPLES